MSFFGTKQDAIKLSNEACHVIDGEDSTSPVRDGGSDSGGASWTHGTAKFENARDHGRPTSAQGQKGVLRTRGV
jgi:hypothetical protein